MKSIKNITQNFMNLTTKEKLTKSYQILLNTVIVLAAIFMVLSLFALILENKSIVTVTSLNIISGILAVTLGSMLFMVGAMGNDSGKGGFGIIVLQLLTMTYILTYIVGLISSISILYTGISSKEYIAKWLASLSLIQLVFIILLFASLLYLENKKRNK